MLSGARGARSDPVAESKHPYRQRELMVGMLRLRDEARFAPLITSLSMTLPMRYLFGFVRLAQALRLKQALVDAV